jgi:hypothetical protein
MEAAADPLARSPGRMAHSTLAAWRGTPTIHRGPGTPVRSVETPATISYAGRDLEGMR